MAEIPEGLEDLFQQSWFDHVLHYGLLVGAIFQLICIAAIVVLPPSAEESSEGEVDRTSCSGSEGVGVGEDMRKTGSTGRVGGGAKKAGKKARKRK